MNEESFLLTKEDFLDYFKKFDAISLEGIWTSFPSISSTGRLHYAAGIYQQLLEQENQRRALERKIESPQQRTLRLLKETEKRIENEDIADLVTLLTI